MIKQEKRLNSKFLHIADLHIGKVVNDFSMLEDQQFILHQISEMAVENEVDALVIAGDIYDRSIPPAEAVTLFDSFLTDLSQKGICIILISGNHDSPERISFGENLFHKQGVYIAGMQKEKLTRVHLTGAGSETEFVLLPFCKPAALGVRTSEEAVKSLLEQYWKEEKEVESTCSSKALEDKKRVLVTHFFVTDAGREPELSDSETTIHIGGLDNVDAAVFDGFDYVALGHIHKSQQIGTRAIWYAGSPLKYSFGETQQTKSALLVSFGKTREAEVKKLALRPLREMRKIRGTLMELLENAPVGVKSQDYLQAVLTDEGELIDPIGTLRAVYPNVMQIVREEQSNTKSTEGTNTSLSRSLTEKRDTMALFEKFYETVRENELSAEGKKIIARIVKELE